MSKSSVYLIDASAFIFRAYYALAPMSSKGRPSHAVAGFASMLLKLLREKKPKSCVVVFDSKKPTFRKEIYSEYKANREVAPPDLSDQIVAVMELCRQAGFALLQDEGMEADDWIASFVRNSFPDEKVIIISSDKDLTQLVDSRVQMYDSFRNKVIDTSAIKEKWGVRPNQMRDLLALTGDSSDNIPGIPGIGPKTAAKLLTDYKTIEGIYKNLEKLPAKQKQKFEESREIVDLSMKLVSLKDDLEVPFKELPDLPKCFPPTLLEFFKEWELTRLISQFAEELGVVKGLEQEAQEESKEKDSSLHLVQTKKDLEALESKIKKKAWVSFDCETSSFQRENAKLIGVSFSFDSDSAYYVPVRHGKTDLSEKEVWGFLARCFEDEKIQKCAHNAKYDLQILTAEGIHLQGLTDDTMIEGHLLYSDRRSVSLDNLSKDFLGESKGDLKALLNGSEDFSTIPLEAAVEYAAKDALLTTRLHDSFEGFLKKDSELHWLYENIEMPLVSVLAEMESTGILVDKKRLKALSKEMHKKLKTLETKVYSLAGHEFNINSPKQLQVVLFEELGLEPIKKTKTGYSTNESVLQELQHEHKLPKLILENRKLSKLTSTYVDVLPDLAWESDGRIHTSYHQTGTTTGRLSSSEPNLQNIPTRSEEGKKIREAFIPAQGYQLLSADYSQVELRLMAHFSEDEKMIAAFSEGRDIHSETAKLIFGSDDKEFRSRAKAINFGIIYGISAFGLSQQLGISRAEAKQFIDSYFEQFPKVKSFMERAVEDVKKNQFSKTLFGRKRPLPDIRSKNVMLRQNAERMAINAPLQGTAADIMKWAMVQVHKAFKEKAFQSRLLLQVHDELVIELWPEEESEVREVLDRAMTDLSETPVRALKVPLVVDTSVGESWAAL